MSLMLDKLGNYLNYPFVRYALAAGTLIALCSSLLGVTLVLKRFSFIGSGLSNVAFFAMSLSTVLSLAFKLPVVLVVTVLCAVFLLQRKEGRQISPDSVIAMVSVGSLAFGYLAMNLFAPSSNLAGDVCSTLFGSTSILTLTLSDVWLCILLSAAVLTVFLLFYHKLFSITFDEEFARATGTRVSSYKLIIAVITAVIIVLSMNLVGSLLISALIIFPALSAMCVCQSFRGVTICSAIFSVCCAVSGILLSILLGTPVGSTIVAIDLLGFACFYLAGCLKGVFHR
ncbi:MAG: metal ABC transporter permease [Suipraeoptans intestinalis]|nr:metal ABC transporter permease [Suipraeoptans intestinalis]MDY3121874.1 metal ABC transporter permease [Suipraeoptans intestinalis]